jgi:hypothetical protein
MTITLVDVALERLADAKEAGVTLFNGVAATTGA